MAKCVQLKVFLAGKVAVEADGVVIDEGRFPGRQGRLLFAYLVAEQGRPVPRDELAEALWAESPPASWDKALTVVVSKLRSLLSDIGLDGSSALTGAFGCYRLELPEGSWVDVVVATDAAQKAEEALAAADHDRARTEASLAVSLAHGAFLPGEESGWVEKKRRELENVRGRALNSLADACLIAGDAAEAVKWAEQAIAIAPYSETGYRRLMNAHTVAGNRGEALRVYERCRRLLADELGAYPSPETESIYRGLLEAPSPRIAATPTAEAPPPDTAPVGAVERGSKGRVARMATRKRVVVAASAVVVSAAAVAGLLATRGAGEATTVAPNSIVALNPSGGIAATVSVGARPVAVASGAGALWVANLDDQSVTRVDVASRQAVRHIPLGDTPTGLAATGTAVWVTDGTGDVSKINPSYDRVTVTKPLRASVGFFGGTVRPALAAFESIWIVSPDGIVLRVDPASMRVVESVAVGNVPSAIAAGAGSVWVTNSHDGTVTRIDPETLVTKPIQVGNGPAAVAVNAAGAWIANAGDNALVRVDTETNAVVETTTVGDGPTAVLATPTALWVANSRDGTVMRLDPRSGRVSKTIRLGGTPSAFAAADGLVWVAIAQPPPQSPPPGGARFTTEDDFTSLDPAFGSWLQHATCANLVTYPDKPAPEGSRIVPEVAEAIPVPTAGGTTYTFRIRSGFRFSPPSNEAVTAMTFKSTIERVTNPNFGSPLSDRFSGIVGYSAYTKGKAREIAGIGVQGSELTIRLTKPNGGFLADLASGAACAVPRGTPAAEGMNDIPSAGPYYIASYTPRQQLVLRRNPNYHGARPQRLNQMLVAIGVHPARGLEQVEAGTADYALELPRKAGPRLESAYGLASKVPGSGGPRYFISEALGARILHMNTSRPLFSDVRLRRAVNYAIDRPALAAQGRRAAEINPFNAGSPTDDYIPPAAVGATDFRLYPTNGPDLHRAKRLAGHTQATAIMYTPNISPWLEEAEIVRRNLKPIGIDVQVKEFPIGDFFTRVSRRSEPFDLAVSGYWMPPDPVQNMALLFDGGGIGSTNFSHFNDPVFNRKLHAVERFSDAKRHSAAARLALELQRDFVPAAAFAVTASRDLFSARIGCQVYHPVWGMDLAALCLRN